MNLFFYMPQENDFFDYLDSPIGSLKITANAEAITSLIFSEETEETKNPNPITNLAIKQLKEYFKHLRTEFSIPLAPEGTAFQQKVWQALQTISYGTTSTYKEIAIKIGNPKAVRAVGSANGKNPIAIIIPCHRVIQTGGNLGGYAGGIEKKQWLLKHEKMNKE